MDIGKLHVVIVHFPIALALSAVLADILWAFTGKDFLRTAGMYTLILAAIAAVPTVMTGWEQLESEQPGMLSDTLDLAHTHRDLAITSMILLISAAVIRIIQRNHPHGLWLRIYAALMVLIFGFISATGHYGGMLTHGPDYLSGLFRGSP